MKPDLWPNDNPNWGRRRQSFSIMDTLCFKCKFDDTKAKEYWGELMWHQNKRRTYKTILICNWHFELNLQLPFNIESWLVSRGHSIEKETKNPEAKMGLTSDLKIFPFNEMSRQAMIKFSWHFLQFNEGFFIEKFHWRDEFQVESKS